MNLPRNEDGLIKLKPRDYTLVDVLDSLIELDANLIRKVTQEKLDKMPDQSEFDTMDPFVIVKAHRTFEDKENGIIQHMVFANHGLIPYCDGEVLEQYPLDETRFFWDYKFPDIPNATKELSYYTSHIFSDDPDALENWTASLNFDEIFDAFNLAGNNDLAGFAGFYYIKDNE